MSMIGLRPHISATEPQTGVTAVLPRINAPPTQMYPEEDWNSAAMDGTAGVTIVRSSDDSNTDRHRGAIISAIVIPDGLAARGSCCATAPVAGPLLVPSCWHWLLLLMLFMTRSAWSR